MLDTILTIIKYVVIIAAALGSLFGIAMFRHARNIKKAILGIIDNAEMNSISPNYLLIQHQHQLLAGYSDEEIRRSADFLRMIEESIDGRQKEIFNHFLRTSTLHIYGEFIVIKRVQSKERRAIELMAEYLKLMYDHAPVNNNLKSTVRCILNEREDAIAMLTGRSILRLDLVITTQYTPRQYDTFFLPE